MAPSASQTQKCRPTKGFLGTLSPATQNFFLILRRALHEIIDEKLFFLEHNEF